MKPLLLILCLTLSGCATTGKPSAPLTVEQKAEQDARRAKYVSVGSSIFQALIKGTVAGLVDGASNRGTQGYAK